MINLIRWVLAYMKRERGATAIEYALMVALIAVAIITILYGVGTQLNAIYQKIIDALTTAPAGP